MAHRDRTPKLLTAEHLYSIEEDRYKFELDEGWLVVMEPPFPEHGFVVARITILLGRFIDEHRLGVVFTGDAGFVLKRDPDVVRGPDVAFVRADRAPTREGMRAFYEGAPDLAVEVRSRNDRPGEIEKKVRNYLDAGAALVWVADPRARTVVVHEPDAEPRVLAEHDTIDGADVVPGFASPVAAFF